TWICVDSGTRRLSPVSRHQQSGASFGNPGGRLDRAHVRGPGRHSRIDDLRVEGRTIRTPGSPADYLHAHARWTSEKTLVASVSGVPQRARYPYSRFTPQPRPVVQDPPGLSSTSPVVPRASRIEIQFESVPALPATVLVLSS